ncbi:SipW-cognate class signal peptide [Halorubrum aquaticum]|uniref:SipW-cognate class signal peptide n=1 Tax=Halorubrum aquaticum TaxID=387340 RepID=A0A1I2Z2V8_9EURY|nr:M73 family metallopeptidase [Halorubrum aquaticum]SFH31836.1 SipW-cognate class signal peptide [Halorubrum aquaticum]
MSDKSGLKISRRKALAGIGGIGVASAGAGLGTSAYFSDTESFEDNAITAGELDLKVDWQQTYDGPEDDSFPAYGAAGYPWVNAHPDEGEGNDPNGIQSLDSDQYDSVPDDGVVTYEDYGANIQSYLTCETLDHDYDFGPNESLIELQDVKPGDSGEITFSYHLCDNPGFVFFCADLIEAGEGGNPEPEENHSDDTGPADETVTDPTGGDEIELLDAIRVQTWYDIDCDNEFDIVEDPLVGSQPTSLRNFLSAFEDAENDNCVLLDPTAYPGISTPGSEKDCVELGGVEFTADGFNVIGDGQVIRVEPGASGDPNDNLQVWVNLVDPTNGENVIIKFGEMEVIGGYVETYGDGDLTNVTQFDWDVIEPPSAGGNVVVGNHGNADGQEFVSSDVGMCESVLTDAGGDTSTADLVGNACSRGENDVGPMDMDAVTSFELSYCAPGSGESRPFPDEVTFCLGFEWTLPESVGNEIQSDYVNFDLGFYTEQARHNDTPGSTLRDDANSTGT